MTTSRTRSLRSFIEETIEKEPGWLRRYLGAKGIVVTDYWVWETIAAAADKSLNSEAQQLLWKLARDAWRQRRANLKKREEKRVSHTITISSSAESYLQLKCQQDDKTISQVIDEILKQKAKAHHNKLNKKSTQSTE